ncbi:MAG: BlaI/MecI/CopY family transcriptional regulator [Verrucomicrobiae bacterium]|nr:BlaI/MecI/CopY family transcriptional regulator [Verrucomicrobiae bacterium]
MKRNNPAPRQVPALSGQEWKLMELLWAKSPQPAYDLIETLAPREQWHPNTIRTMLARLVRKGAVQAEPYKNLYLYSAARTRDQLVDAETRSFLERVFGGAIRPALIYFATRQRLSPEEVREMKRLLDEHTNPKKP